MEIKKRDNEHGVTVYDLIGLTLGKVLAIERVIENASTNGSLTPVEYDVWLAISRALEPPPYERSKP